MHRQHRLELLTARDDAVEQTLQILFVGELDLDLVLSFDGFHPNACVQTLAQCLCHFLVRLRSGHTRRRILRFLTRQESSDIFSLTNRELLFD